MLLKRKFRLFFQFGMHSSATYAEVSFLFQLFVFFGNGAFELFRSISVDKRRRQRHFVGRLCAAFLHHIGQVAQLDSFLVRGCTF